MNEPQYQDQGTQAQEQIDRRKYPTDIKTGGKSEWMGMEQHLQEISQELQRNEKEIINLRKNEFLSELDKIAMEKLQQKQYELELKQFEANEILRRHQMYEEEKKKFLEDRQMLQKQLATIYDRQKSDAIVKELEYRQQRLEWERLSLEENRKRMESERQRRQVQRDFRAREQEQDMQLYLLKQQEQQQKLQKDHQEQVLLANNYAEREIIKEENYRNFYKSVAESQAQLQKMHIEKVMIPLLERQKQLEDMIMRNVDMYQKKLLQDELDRVMRKQREFREVLNVNKDIIVKHESQKEIKKQERENLNKKRDDDLKLYHSYMDGVKNEKIQRQKQYKDFLDQQRLEKQMINLQQGKMGKEKAMNYADLNSYKIKDPQLHSLIPGYSPQIGQLPPYVGNPYIQQKASLDQIKENEQRIINLRGPEEGSSSRGQGQGFQGVGQSIIGHNPITGTHTFYQQNPYIRQQMYNSLQPNGVQQTSFQKVG